MKTERRTHYFIKRKFQSIFIIKFCALVLLGSLISTGIIYYITKGTVTTSFENLRLVIKSTADYILPAVLIATGIVAIVISIATIFLTLYTSHKIAGPLYRIEKELEKLEEGDLTVSIKLRSGDEIQYLAEKLNASISNIRNSLSDLKKEFYDLERLFQEDGAKNTKIKEQLEKIRKTLKNLKTN